jgi:hypothetical protein
MLTRPRQSPCLAVARSRHSHALQAVLMSNQTAFSTFVTSSVTDLKAALQQEFGRSVRVSIPLAERLCQLYALCSKLQVCCEN